MTNWDTTGLPPAAAQRMQSILKSRVKGSMLSVAGATSILGVGFSPVSEVMGAIVLNTTGATFPNCGYYPTSFGLGMGYGYQTQGTNSQYGFAPMYLQYVDVLNNGWSKALERMTVEAKTLKADGVIDVQLQQNHLGSNSIEFMAIGTAINAPASNLHLKEPFTTHLNGTDVAKLLIHGYAPVKTLVEISVGVRHDDYKTLSQASAFAPNTEVSGYTDLITTTRANARRRLEDSVKRSGAQGAIVDSMRLMVFENEPFENHRDHIAQAQIIGTTITSFSNSHRPSNPLTFLSLK